MKADLAGKAGEHMAGQVLSRSDRYWQWLYLGCAEVPFHHQQSAPRRAARVMAVRCLEAQLIRRWLVYSKASHSWGQDISKETEGLLCLLRSREWRDDQELAWELCQLVRRKFVQVQPTQAWHGLLRKTILGQPEIDLNETKQIHNRIFISLKLKERNHSSEWSLYILLFLGHTARFHRTHSFLFAHQAEVSRYACWHCDCPFLVDRRSKEIQVIILTQFCYLEVGRPQSLKMWIPRNSWLWECSLCPQSS